MKRLIAAFGIVACGSASTLADGHFWGVWSSGPTEFSAQAAWVSELDDTGNLVTATVQCAADVPYLNVAWIQGETEQAEAQMQITVDGRPYWLNARYLFYAAEPGWTVQLLPDVTDALRSGASFNVQVATRGPTDLRLRGSADAIDAALEGCGTGAGFNAENVNYFSFLAPDASGTLRPVDAHGDAVTEGPSTPTPDLPSDTPISRAELEASWAEQCPSGATVADTAVRTADLDGDGAPDVLVNYADIRCDGAGSVSMMRGLGFCGMHNCTLAIYLS